MNTKEVKPAVRFYLLGQWPGADIEITKELINIVFDIVEELFGKNFVAQYRLPITQMPQTLLPVMI